MSTESKNATSSFFAVGHPVVNISNPNPLTTGFAAARKIYFPSMVYEPRCSGGSEKSFDAVWVQKFSFLALLTPTSSAFSFGLLAKGVDSMGQNSTLELDQYADEDGYNAGGAFAKHSIDDVRRSLHGVEDYSSVAAVASAVFNSFAELQRNDSFVCVYRTRDQVCTEDSDLYQIEYFWKKGKIEFWKSSCSAKSVLCEGRQSVDNYIHAGNGTFACCREPPCDQLVVFIDSPTHELVYYVAIGLVILLIVLGRTAVGESNKNGVVELDQVLKERELQASLFKRKMEYLEAKETQRNSHSHHSKTWKQMEHEQDEALLGTIPTRDQFEWVKRRRRRGVHLQKLPRLFDLWLHIAKETALRLVIRKTYATLVASSFQDLEEEWSTETVQALQAEMGSMQMEVEEAMRFGYFTHYMVKFRRVGLKMLKEVCRRVGIQYEEEDLGTTKSVSLLKMVVGLTEDEEEERACEDLCEKIERASEQQQRDAIRSFIECKKEELPAVVLTFKRDTSKFFILEYIIALEVISRRRGTAADATAIGTTLSARSFFDPTFGLQLVGNPKTMPCLHCYPSRSFWAWESLWGKSTLHFIAFSFVIQLLSHLPLFVWLLCFCGQLQFFREETVQVGSASEAAFEYVHRVIWISTVTSMVWFQLALWFVRKQIFEQQYKHFYFRRFGQGLTALILHLLMPPLSMYFAYTCMSQEHKRKIKDHFDIHDPCCPLFGLGYLMLLGFLVYYSLLYLLLWLCCMFYLTIGIIAEHPSIWNTLATSTLVVALISALFTMMAGIHAEYNKLNTTIDKFSVIRPRSDEYEDELLQEMKNFFVDRKQLKEESSMAEEKEYVHLSRWPLSFRMVTPISGCFDLEDNPLLEISNCCSRKARQRSNIHWQTRDFINASSYAESVPSVLVHCEHTGYATVDFTCDTRSNCRICKARAICSHSRIRSQCAECSIQVSTQAELSSPEAGADTSNATFIGKYSSSGTSSSSSNDTSSVATFPAGRNTPFPAGPNTPFPDGPNTPFPNRPNGCSDGVDSDGVELLPKSNSTSSSTTKPLGTGLDSKLLQIRGDFMLVQGTVALQCHAHPAPRADDPSWAVGWTNGLTHVMCYGNGRICLYAPQNTSFLPVMMHRRGLLLGKDDCHMSTIHREGIVLGSFDFNEPQQQNEQIRIVCTASIARPNDDEGQTVKKMESTRVSFSVIEDRELQVDEGVEARQVNQDKWCKATITGTLGDDTYDLAYENGDTEEGVRRFRIRTDTGAAVQTLGPFEILGPCTPIAFHPQERDAIRYMRADIEDEEEAEIRRHITHQEINFLLRRLDRTLSAIAFPHVILFVFFAVALVIPRP
jgi:hypothetical protein